MAICTDTTEVVHKRDRPNDSIHAYYKALPPRETMLFKENVLAQ